MILGQAVEQEGVHIVAHAEGKGFAFEAARAARAFAAQAVEGALGDDVPMESNLLTISNRKKTRVAYGLRDAGFLEPLQSAGLRVEVVDFGEKNLPRSCARCAPRVTLPAPMGAT